METAWSWSCKGDLDTWFFVGTVFAYGQSGSGKTYTMSGDRSTPGIISQAMNDIFDFIEKVSSPVIHLFHYVCRLKEIELLEVILGFSPVLHIFRASSRTKRPGDQILIGHSVLMIQKQKDTDLQKTKLVVVNMTWKAEVHITDNSVLEQLP